MKQLDEKIEKLKKENAILNNLISSCSYQNLTKDYISNLDSTKPFVSVIITVYNLGRRYLVQCLESVINQSLKNIEIILVNDCSPLEEDDKVCSEYANKDKRIKYIKHDSNMGDGKSPVFECVLHREIAGSLQRNMTDVHFVQNAAQLTRQLLCTGAYYNLIR